jgi:hypothetical protein
MKTLPLAALALVFFALPSSAQLIGRDHRDILAFLEGDGGANKGDPDFKSLPPDEKAKVLEKIEGVVAAKRKQWNIDKKLTYLDVMVWGHDGRTLEQVRASLQEKMYSRIGYKGRGSPATLDEGDNPTQREVEKGEKEHEVSIELPEIPVDTHFNSGEWAITDIDAGAIKAAIQAKLPQIGKSKITKVAVESSSDGWPLSDATLKKIGPQGVHDNLALSKKRAEALLDQVKTAATGLNLDLGEAENEIAFAGTNGDGTSGPRPAPGESSNDPKFAPHRRAHIKLTIKNTYEKPPVLPKYMIDHSAYILTMAVEFERPGGKTLQGQQFSGTVDYSVCPQSPQGQSQIQRLKN